MIGRSKELEDVSRVASSFPTYLGKIEATLLVDTKLCQLQQIKQVSRCCINFPHELTCQILTNQNTKTGRRVWPSIPDKMSWDTSLKTFFYVLLTSKGGNIAFLPRPLRAMLWNGGDRGGVRILLFSEVTLFKYNVSTSGRTSFRKWIEFISLGWDARPLVAFYLLCSTSSYLF